MHLHLIRIIISDYLSLNVYHREAEEQARWTYLEGQIFKSEQEASTECTSIVVTQKRLHNIAPVKG